MNPDPPSGRTTPAFDVEDFFARLSAEPWEFDFFTAVRMLDCAAPQKPRTGTADRPALEPVRFAQAPSLACEGRSIASYHHQPPAGQDGAARPDKRPDKLTVNFLGLLGTNGPMPLFFTEYVRDRRNKGDHGIARFLDMFNHRMISLFYRAWAMHQRTVAFDRARHQPEEDAYAKYVGSLCACGTPAVRNRDAIPDVAKLHFAGRLSCPTRHAEGLEAILAAYFRITARIRQFVGQWVRIPDENRCFLGLSAEAGRIGMDVVLGEKTYDYQRRFRVEMGPMNFADYSRMLPGGSSVGRLKAWTRAYLGDEYEWEAQLVIAAREIPVIQLGMVGELGYSTWLFNQPIADDRGDLVKDVSDL
jgi:type VI secretion system protein ImpH